MPYYSLLYLFFLLFTTLQNVADSFSIPEGRAKSIITGASGYLGREVVHQILLSSQNNDDKKEDSLHDDLIYCLVRSTRVEEEQNYWSAFRNVQVLPYDMLDDGESIFNALKTALSDHEKGSEEAEEEKSTCCIRVFHVASIFSPTEDHVSMAHDNVRGTENVMKMVDKLMKSNSDDKVNVRVLVTSSMAAVRASGQSPLNGKYYTHEDWNTESELGKGWGGSYRWSKTESERRAWQLSKEHNIPLTTLCPPFIFGPSSSMELDSTNSYSIQMVKSWIEGKSPVQSRLCVDVRDIAKAHAIASNLSHTIGERYIISTEERISSEKMAKAIESSFPSSASSMSCDTDFDGGAIKIGEKEVECTQRCKDELDGLVCRSVDETMSDMATVFSRMK